MLQCIGSICRSTLAKSPPSVNVDFVQNVSDSRKKLICKPELQSLEAIFEMLKQENKNTRTQEHKNTRTQANKHTSKLAN
jgi:hypothetical protein